MKTIISIIFSFISIFTFCTCQSQAWDIFGNDIIGAEYFGNDGTYNIPVRFQNHYNGSASEFQWWTNPGTIAERMRLTRAGWLGLNITAPAMMLHVNNGGILSTGTTGTNPDLGAGTRLMWVPSQSAFRVGSVSGDQWDSGNVGGGSYSMGSNNIASAYGTFAMGQENEVSGNFSHAIGFYNEVPGVGAFAIGKSNIVEGIGSFSLGCFTHSTENFGFVLGSGVDDTDPLTNSIENSLYVGFNSDIPTLYVGPSDGVDTWGNVGVNTTDPQMLLHVNEGGILSTGTTGANPDLGTGTRLMWIPGQAAFRAGEAMTYEWDAANVGSHSTAFGQGQTASGDYSFAAGLDNMVESETGVAFGTQNHLEATATFGFAAGSGHHIEGAGGVALGGGNDAMDNGSVAFGLLCKSEGITSIAGGFQTNSNGDFSIAMGYEALADYDHAIALGNGARADYINCVAIGKNAWAEADDNIAIGDIHNDIAESLKLGFTGLGEVLFAGPGASGGPVSGVGIGGIDEPTERLDVDGNARFRVIPDVASDVLITGVQEDGEGDYSLSYFEFNNDADSFLGGDGEWHDMPAAEQCDWNVSGENIIMGYATGSPTACQTGNVGIGTASPTSKFHLAHAPAASGTTAQFTSTATSIATHTGISSTAQGGTTRITGISGTGNASSNTTVSGSSVTGVNGTGSSSLSGTDYTGYTNIYGVYGSTTGAAAGSSYFAGFFNGNVTVTGNWSNPSDQNLKENISDIDNASLLLSQMHPKKYNFIDSPELGINLPKGEQLGLIAQDLEEVLPNLVSNIHHPGPTNDDGDFSGSGFDFKSINYIELIPLLIGGHQEQQATIAMQQETLTTQQEALSAFQEALTAQQAQIEALTALVASCCASDKSNNSGPGTPKASATDSYDLNIERATLDQNVPNPFTTETSITYRIPEQAQVRVRILGADGSQKDILVDGLMPRGEYRIIWNAAHLPAGMYYYTLEVDGVELVKKAVKL